MSGLRSCLAGIVLCALLTGVAGAEHICYQNNIINTISPWAKEEIQRGVKIGIPDLYCSAGDEGPRPITRDNFCELSVNYLAVQMGYDLSRFTGVFTSMYQDEHGEPYRDNIFWDTDREEVNIAFYMGVAEGRRDASFDPNSLITRQEAATMMVRAYRALGGTLPREAGEFHFADESQIAGYALESVQALAYWSVLQGREDGRFAPQDPITIEEAMLCYIRLYEKAPVSRKNAPIPPMFSYEECLESWDKSAGMMVSQTIQGPTGTLVQLTGRGIPHAAVAWDYLTPEGAMRPVRFGLCPPIMSCLSFSTQPHFSEDGNFILADVYMAKDVLSYEGELLHEKGVYHVRIDVETLTPEVTRSELPTVEPPHSIY